MGDGAAGRVSDGGRRRWKATRLALVAALGVVALTASSCTYFQTASVIRY